MGHKLVKVQFLVSEEDAKQLQALVRKGGFTTLSEMLRNALSVYMALVEEVERGGRIQIVTPDGEEQTLIIPTMRHHRLRSREHTPVTH